MSVTPPESRTPDLPDRFADTVSPATVSPPVSLWDSVVYVERRRVTVIDTTLEKIIIRPTAATLASPPEAPLNCSIFCTDVAGFGDPRRDDDDRRVIRAALYRILRDVFEASNVPWDACVHEDRGDGTLTVAPPTVATGPLVDPLIPMLAARLKRYNRQAGDPVRIQLRAALHVGPVAPDLAGLRGHALIHAARMLDAPTLKDALTDSGADLAFIASSHVYETVIRHAVGLVDPATFRRVRVNVKESNAEAWVCVTG